MYKGLVLLLASVIYLEAVIATNVCHLSEDIRPTEGACKDHTVKSRFCVKDEAAGKMMASSAKTYLEGSTITSATCDAKYDTMCAAAGGTRKVTRTSCEFLCSQLAETLSHRCDSIEFAANDCADSDCGGPVTIIPGGSETASTPLPICCHVGSPHNCCT
jgi:hypothetical protein